MDDEILTELSTPEEPHMRKLYTPQDDDEGDTVDVICGEGYDSDGDAPPLATHWDTYHSESKLPSSDVIVPSKEGKRTGSVNGCALIGDVEIGKMKVDDLRAELTKRGISSLGLKKELVEKLTRTIAHQVPIVNQETTCSATTGFPTTAQWHLLDTDSLDTVRQPVNEVGNAYSPNDRRGLGLARKYDYKEDWSRENFDSKCLQPVLDPDGGLVSMAMLPITALTPITAFISKHKLDNNSHPADWIRSFVPNSKSKGAPAHEFCTDNWTSYLNTRAMQELAGIRERGGSYDTFIPFEPDEVEKHIALYMVQGLIPSPTLGQKLSYQTEEPIQGNDLIASAIGKGAGKRHQQFRKWFAVQNMLRSN